MPIRTVTEQIGSGMTAHTRTRRVVEFSEPLTKEEVEEIKLAFASVRPRDPIDRARGLAERTLAAIAAGDTDDDDFDPRAGMGWYSTEIIKRCDWITKGRERGDDVARLIELGFEIGQLLTEAGMKRAFDKDVEVAKAVTSAGEASRRGRPAEMRVEAIKRLRAGGMPPGQAIATIASEDGVTVKAVEKQYYKKRPTGVSRK